MNLCWLVLNYSTKLCTLAPNIVSFITKESLQSEIFVVARPKQRKSQTSKEELLPFPPSQTHRRTQAHTHALKGIDVREAESVPETKSTGGKESSPRAPVVVRRDDRIPQL